MSLKNFWNAGGTGINTVKQIIWAILGGAGILTMCCGLPASKGFIGTDWTHSHGVATFFVIIGIFITFLAVAFLIRVTSNKNK